MGGWKCPCLSLNGCVVCHGSGGTWWCFRRSGILRTTSRHAAWPDFDSEGRPISSSLLSAVLVKRFLFRWFRGWLLRGETKKFVIFAIDLFVILFKWFPAAEPFRLLGDKSSFLSWAWVWGCLAYTQKRQGKDCLVSWKRGGGFMVLKAWENSLPYTLMCTTFKNFEIYVILSIF